MKVLWVVNMLIGALSKRKNINLSSGQWLNAELEKSYGNKEYDIIVCTSSSEYEELIDENIKYVVVPHGDVASYRCNNDNVEYWKSLLDKEKPDVILIWGTEYLIGQCVLIANNHKFKSCIYIQGVMSSIAENYRGGLSDSTISSFSTVVERLRHTTIFDKEKEMNFKVSQEKLSITLTDGIIVENQWAADRYLSLNPNLKLFWNRLSINTIFQKYSWSKDKYKEHTIITTAAGYPLKGLHFLFEALYYVKKVYPDVKLIIPGPDIVHAKGIISKFKQSGYGKYLLKLIARNGLDSNVSFVGILPPYRYAELMSRSEIFVSASAVENHCSALREAMTIGVPCISSRVGGVPFYAKHNENALLYAYDKPKELAEYIIQLFSSSKLKQYISQNAHNTIRDMYLIDHLDSLTEIYNKIN